MTNTELHTYMVNSTLDKMNYYMNHREMDMAEAHDIVKKESCAGPSVWADVTDIIINR